MAGVIITLATIETTTITTGITQLVAFDRNARSESGENESFAGVKNGNGVTTETGTAAMTHATTAIVILTDLTK